MSEVPVVTVPNGDSEAIRQIREQLNTVLAEKKAVEAERDAHAEKIKAEERAKLEETDRLKAELQDEKGRVETLATYQQKAEQMETKFKALFDARVATLPAEMQEKANKLTANQPTAADRYEALMELEPLLVPAQVPRVAGSPGNPSIPGVVGTPPAEAPKVEPKDWGKIDFGAAARDAATPGGKTPVGVKE